MPDIRKTFGQRIRERRVVRKLSQEKLAELADLDRTYIGGIERGERNPSLANIEKIASALGLEIRDLFQFKAKKQ